ncbi:MAG: tRNA (guanosine(46)-N7)-methyltransferase TrmB [Planctomycetes bacterium]|nr:tRNA (guanosine(46)-N7)-methyltransferase TrmB [Planctomycetota bacterium]
MQTNPPLDLKPYFLTLADLESPIDWQNFFGNANPVEIDVGSGRGLFLVTAAVANSAGNYLGLEIDFREGRRAARRLKKRELPNARVLGGDANLAFSRFVPAESVAAVHVYFPDPWWKRKHRRRRVFNEEFVTLMHRVLEPGGLVHSWTDVAEYFEVISGLMNSDKRFEALPPLREKSPEHDMDYRTSFERKKRKEGFPISRGLWRKLGENRQ